MAINDITGKVIKTNPTNSQYINGWERVFDKKTAHEWMLHPDFKSYTLLDPDGWRTGDGVTMDDKITYNDFHNRLTQSTVSFKM